MITARDLQPLVQSPLFQRLLKLSEADKASKEYRALKGLDRVARGATRRDDNAELKDERRQQRIASGQSLDDPDYRDNNVMASVRNPRQSVKETTGDGNTEHLSV